MWVSQEWRKNWDGLTVQIQDSPSSIPFDRESFDVVTAACVFHHVPLSERAPLVESARAVLKPGGVFCIFEHNSRNPVTRNIVRRCPLDINAQLLDPKETSDLLQEAGFQQVSTQYYLFAPEFLGRRLPFLERSLKRIPIGGQYAAFGQRLGE